METRCFYQAYKEGKSTMLGTGDCSICLYDSENNCKCPGYVPVQLAWVKTKKEEDR